MNQELSRWADISAMLLSVILSVVYTIKLTKSAKGSFRPLALFFLIFGPMAIGVHMAAHQLLVNYLAVGRMFKGSFVYDFRFYALNLMGILLAILSFNLLRYCLDYYNGEAAMRAKWLTTCGWIALVAAPTIPFTFIGSLPLQAIIINLIASRFVRRKEKVRVLRMHVNAAEPAGSKVLSAVD